MRAAVLAALLLAACSRAPSGPYAVFETSKGRMVARLLPDAAPKTVAHFSALANGTKPWRGPKGEVVVRPLYDGTVFHRVIPGLLVQGGDPAGTGDGDPAVPVPDEWGAKFDRAGLLGLASWGPGTSQSQFFITLGPARDLDGRYALFGELVEGQGVADAIAAVPRDEKSGSDRPFAPPVLKSVRVVERRPRGARGRGRAPRRVRSARSTARARCARRSSSGRRRGSGIRGSVSCPAPRNEPAAPSVKGAFSGA